MSSYDNKNLSLQGEEPGAEQQGVGPANDDESVPLLNFDVLVRPDGPTSKTNDVTGLEWIGLNHVLLQREAILLVQRELYIYVWDLGKVLVSL